MKGERTSVNDDPSVCPSSVTCVEVTEQRDQRIWDNRRISIDETGSEMSISHRKKVARVAYDPTETLVKLWTKCFKKQCDYTEK
jgi:hypothetical protein